MTREGKEFEELVTRIERLLAPTGAIIKSPDYIEEKVTGKTREVDVSIRYKIGSVPILITIECRDRNDVEDVTWIEQLVTKKQNIGASKTIAVSSFGFSENAIKNAKLYDLEIRIINEIEDRDILDWPNRFVFRIGQVLVLWGILNVVMYVDREVENIIFEPSENELYQKHGLEAEIFIRNLDESKWSIRKIFQELTKDKDPVQVLRRGDERQIVLPPHAMMVFSNDPMSPFLLEGVPADGTVINKKLTMRFPKGEFSINTNNGRFDICELTVNIGVSHKHTESPKTKIIEYSSDENAIVQLAETEILIDESKNLKVKVYQHRVLER